MQIASRFRQNLLGLTERAFARWNNRQGPLLRWPAYIWSLAAASLICFLGMVAAIAVVDPWKAMPLSASIKRPVLYNKQRLLYPMLIREKHFDSMILGSSTGMLLDPDNVSELGGRFMNLALTDGRAWEQLELLQLAVSEDLRPRVVLFTIDWVWCIPELVRGENEIRRFPSWIYDKLSWINVRRLLNADALDDAWLAIQYNRGRFQPPIRDNGYWIFTLPEDKYDLQAALKEIYDSGKRQVWPPVVPPEPVPEGETWPFPYLDLMENMMSRMPATRFVFAAMPVHVIMQPRPGTMRAQREQMCKQRIARIAAKHGSILIDFRIDSAVTRRDDNYWDALHFRVSIARRLEESIVAAVRSQRSDPDGFWRIIDAR